MMVRPEMDAVWLAEHPDEEHRFSGEWILVENERIIAHDRELSSVLKVAEDHPEALLAQAHGDEGLIL